MILSGNNAELEGHFKNYDKLIPHLDDLLGRSFGSEGDMCLYRYETRRKHFVRTM